MSINLKELSNRLGLSPTTVSRALAGYSDVSPITRERVREMATELNYQPSRAARQVAMGRADAVGIVYSVGADYLGNPAFLEMLRAFSLELEQAGIDLLLAASPQQHELRTYDRMTVGRRVDALLVAHTLVKDPRIEHLLQSGAPFLAYGRTANADRYPWFDFDNVAGGRMTVQRLAQLGHSRIAYVHSPLQLNFAYQRHIGFKEGMRKARLKIATQAVVQAGLERRSGFAAAQQLLALPQRPTAIVVDNSLAGVGVIRALLDAGLVVGHDISVLVYEGIPQDTLLRDVQVAAIVQPTPDETGQTMGRMILALLRGEQLDEPHVLRQPVFIDGNSIAAPRT